MFLKRKHVLMVKLTFYLLYLYLAIYIFRNLLQENTPREEYKTDHLYNASPPLVRTTAIFRNKSMAFQLHKEQKKTEKKSHGNFRRKLGKINYHEYPLAVDLRVVLDKLQNKERVSLEVINPHSFHYIINPEKKCLSSKTSLLILVKSAADHIENRNAIRKTWGNITDNTIKIVFLIGSSTFDSDIIIENAINHDIVQENFIDVYWNNTYKTVMAFNWATTYCSMTRHLFFVDDDYYVNLPNLLFFLQHNNRDVSLLSGYLLPMSAPFRDNSSKWYVSVEEYPFHRYPPYLAGGAIIVSMDVAQQLAAVFPYVKYLVIDDAYLGIVAYKLGIRISLNGKITDKHCQDWRLRLKIACHGFGNASTLLQTWKRLKDTAIKVNI